MKKELIWGFYAVLIIVLGILGYFLAKVNKFEYSLLGALIGILSSLILWVTWGSSNVDN
jgi:hypothetical protein